MQRRFASSVTPDSNEGRASCVGYTQKCTKPPYPTPKMADSSPERVQSLVEEADVPLLDQARAVAPQRLPAIPTATR